MGGWVWLLSLVVSGFVSMVMPPDEPAAVDVEAAKAEAARAKKIRDTYPKGPDGEQVPRETMAEMAGAIARKECSNNFHDGSTSGSDLPEGHKDGDFGNYNTMRPTLDQMRGCLTDKWETLKDERGPLRGVDPDDEEFVNFVMAGQRDLAACCVPPPAFTVQEDCVEQMSETYLLIRGAKEVKDFTKPMKDILAYQAALGERKKTQNKERLAAMKKDTAERLKMAGIKTHEEAPATEEPKKRRRKRRRRKKKKSYQSEYDVEDDDAEL